MPQSYVTQDGIQLIAPGTYVAVSVQANQGNIATTGVVTLIGEADEGAGFLDEADLSQNQFAPDEIGKVIRKYGSGRIVDAFSQIVAASDDPNILGAVNLVRIVKTNQSSQAKATMKNRRNIAYSVLTARKNGAAGNTIKFKNEILAAEIAPTTGKFTYAPSLTASTTVALRTNGGELQTITVPAKTKPSVMALEVIDAGILMQGGQENKTLTSSVGDDATIEIQTDTSLILLTLQAGSTFDGSPKKGDTAIIPQSGDFGAAADSALIGTAGANSGVYIIQQVSNTATNASMILKRISGPAGENGTFTIAADTDLLLYSQMELKNMTGDRKLSTVGLSGLFETLSNDGTNAIVKAPAAWATQPQVGDIVKYAATFAGVTAGFYMVVAVASDRMTITRLSNGSAGTTGTQTIVLAITEATEPFQVLNPTLIGTGKTLSTESDVSAIFLKDTGADANLSNSQKISASEERDQTTYTKDLNTESFKAGGEIALAVGCSEEDAEMIVTENKIEFYVAGDLRFTADLKVYKTLASLASYISSQTNFSASVPVGRLQATSPRDLDESTYTISGLAIHKNGRIKRDAADWLASNAGCSMVSVTLSASAGLPSPMSTEMFLADGAKNGTTSAMITTAIDACEKLETNFIVTLFSQDASADILAEDTESTSSYTIDAINLYAKSHALKMSTVKARKNRIALVSKIGTYDEVKQAAGELSTFRSFLTPQLFRTFSQSTNDTKVFQPWMSAVDAAGMQAAAGYKGIVKKKSNCAGISMPYGDFDPNALGDVEDALKSGLLFMEKIPTGGFRWVSDQSTYTFDNNFVYNSLQAVYLSDIMTLTLIQEYDRLVVGKSVAEISATIGLSILETQMFNFKRLRFITASDDAPKGFKNPKAKLVGGVLEISVEIKLAGLIYFVPINLAISQVQQSA